MKRKLSPPPYEAGECSSSGSRRPGHPPSTPWSCERAENKIIISTQLIHCPWFQCLKKNLNASRPSSEHPRRVRGKNVRTSINSCSCKMERQYHYINSVKVPIGHQTPPPYLSKFHFFSRSEAHTHVEREQPPTIRTVPPQYNISKPPCCAGSGHPPTVVIKEPVQMKPKIFITLKTPQSKTLDIFSHFTASSKANIVVINEKHCPLSLLLLLFSSS